MSKKINRRSFLKGAAAGGAGLPVPARQPHGVRLRGQREAQHRDHRLRRQRRRQPQAVSGENIVALCDMNDKTIAEGREGLSRRRQGYADFRRMLDQMDKRDRRRGGQHARPHPRRRRGDGDEDGQALLLREAAHALHLRGQSDARHRAQVQSGDPDGQPGHGQQRPARGRRGHPRRRARAGRSRCTSGPTGPSGRRASSARRRRRRSRANLHWDLWLGPAPERPYNPCYQPFNWRGWIDFGTGALGDMGCHTLNMPFMALDLRNPISVEAEVVRDDDGDLPEAVDHHLPVPRARTTCGPLRLKWYDGSLKPSADALRRTEAAGQRVRDHRRQGRLLAAMTTAASYELLPEEQVRRISRSPSRRCRARPATTQSGSARARAASPRCRTSTTPRR